jgi:hypothetical protein
MITRDILKRGLRLLNAISSGVDPTADEAADGLQTFKSMILALPGIAQGSSWSDVIVTADAPACEDQRITCADAITITLPTQVPDYSGVYPIDRTLWTGAYRPIRDGARVAVIKPSTQTLQFWRSDLGQWMDALGFGLTDECPFNASLHDGLAAMFAVAVGPEYGPPAQPAVVQMAEKCRRDLYAKLVPSQPVGVELSAMPSNLWSGYRNGLTF